MAEELVTISSQLSLALTNRRVDRLVALWKALHPCDRAKTVTRPRFRSEELRGRYRQAKAPKEPGVEASRR